MDKKYFRCTSPLYILKGRMGEDALLRIACGKDHPDNDEIEDMKSDLAHLEQIGYICVIENEDGWSIELTDKGETATASIAIDTRTSDADETSEESPGIPKTNIKHGIYIALAGASAIGTAIFGALKFHGRKRNRR